MLDSQRNSGLINYALIIEEGRPDPSTDPDVGRLIDGHFRKATKFAGHMIRHLNRRTDFLHYKLNCTGLEDDCNRLGIWQEGQVSGNEEETTATLVLGADYGLNDNLFAGFSLGYGQTSESIGNLGTYSEATTNIYAGYFAAKLPGGFYLDGALGHGEIKFKDRRYILLRDVTETSERRGDYQFGSLKLSGDYPMQNNMVLSPYARYEAVRTNLDAYRESGISDLSLAYGNTNQTSQRAVVGAALEKVFPRRWGVITGTIQAEIGRNHESGYRQTITYLDTPDTTYVLEKAGSSSRHAALGLEINLISGPSHFDFGIFATQSGSSSKPDIGATFGWSYQF
ncbi:autotransporter outer membrane beta-barrel domain-containing protein [Shimia abyssi]|uniref:autotransporter outer membrane beta-barrel domain-containing protein n=1 Tax=Shimia abyssi TaxID=1662395 RepID=UPI00311AA3E9